MIANCYFILLLSDLNECNRTPYVCLQGGTCSNYAGGYSCSCTDGWEGHSCQTGMVHYTQSYPEIRRHLVDILCLVNWSFEKFFLIVLPSRQSMLTHTSSASTSEVV